MCVEEFGYIFTVHVLTCSPGWGWTDGVDQEVPLAETGFHQSSKPLQCEKQTKTYCVRFLSYNDVSSSFKQSLMQIFTYLSICLSVYLNKSNTYCNLPHQLSLIALHPASWLLFLHQQQAPTKPFHTATPTPLSQMNQTQSTAGCKPELKPYATPKSELLKQNPGHTTYPPPHLKKKNFQHFFNIISN